MNYKLAKKLKNAGFPQEGNDDNCYHIGPDPKCNGDCNPSCICYFPTLSELIEACGDKFFRLVNFNGYSDNTWQAEAHNYLGHGQGKTPEEAVVKLWLELNTK